MRMVDLINKKVGRGELTSDEISFIVSSFVEGAVPDYQMSAFMMAVLFNGMTNEEAKDLTLCMMNSGDTIDLSALPGIKVDKHSTGGVGDTTTLVVAPAVAACGGTVAKMSGRGLGHTGGTIDKLESVPGLSVEQPIERFFEIVKKTGVAVIGQSANLDPADKKMYALRDVTGTVQSIPLIASSIMSKKLAAGADAIVLDVKVGSGAFMKTVEEAVKLSRLMVDIGNSLGRRVVALITDMNQPLGLAIGNALEVRDAVLLLSGKVARNDLLYRICRLLAAEMLVLSNLSANIEEGEQAFDRVIDDGSALMKLKQMIHEEGGDESYIDPVRIDELCRTKKIIPVKSEKSGYISGLDAVKIGQAAQMLGAGRAKLTDKIDPAVGMIMKKRIGDAVSKGDILAEFYVNDETLLPDAIELFCSAFAYSNEKPEDIPLVYSVVK